MKVNLSEECTRDTMLSHVILSAMTSTFKDEAFAKFVKGKQIFEVKLTIDGKEVDLKEFVDSWQTQVCRLIEEKATEILQSRMSDLMELWQDLENRLGKEIEKRLEDWEKEER